MQHWTGFSEVASYMYLGYVSGRRIRNDFDIASRLAYHIVRDVCIKAEERCADA